MRQLSVFLVLAVTLNVALGMTFRHKRQLNDEDENLLDDRYGWDRNNRPQRPNQGGNGWFRPGNQRPTQGGNQWEQPNQGGNQWAQPNQGGNQWAQPNQGGNQWAQPNQGGNQWAQPNQGGNQWEQPNQGGNQWAPPNQGGNQPQTTPAPNENGSTTQSSAIQVCIRNCPVTPEYNPVCGTDLVQYTNAGRLTCAQSCGVNVSLLRSSPCPPTTTTAAPAT